MPLREYSPLDEMERADRARLVPLLDQTGGDEATNDKREDLVGDPDENDFLSVRELRNQYLDYLYSKTEEIEEQKDSRRYYHGAQLTAEQLRVLKARHQPVQIWNRVGRKINQIVGVVMKMRTDPKAEGRDPKSEAGAEVANQSIRYVLDSNQFKSSIDHMCLLQAGMEAISGVQLVMIKGDKGDPDVGMNAVVGDEYFYDPRSYNYWFKDNRFEGIAKWMDLDAAVDMFPNKRSLLEGLFEGDSDLTTNPDREIKWLISSAKRLRMVEQWYRWKGEWRWAFYVANVLLDQGVSPFYDEKGQSASSFEMFSAAIDQDGDRYSFVRNFKGPQDALNQGKSKTLALANSRRVVAEKGAVDDVERARIEISRHDGYVERNPGKDFKVDDTHPDIASFSAFTEDAKNELDGYANTGIAAASAPGLVNISGKAIELLRQPGMAELGPFVLAHRAWKLNLYRKIWNTVQRHWTSERWLRVNNNQKVAEFIQLNGVDLDPFGRPVIVNAVGQLDVNIILDEGPDIVSMMQELSDKLSKYPPGTFPPAVLIEMDPNLPRSEKDRLLQMMQPKPEQLQIQQAQTRLTMEGLAARNAKTSAEVQRTLAQVEKESATASEKRAKVTTEADAPDTSRMPVIWTLRNSSATPSSKHIG
ncbi:MAG TPA: hypothetical protein VKT24_07690 [Rhizomicrobium sp.]|nr:hypothetical protein [Rhizomicrobium sp.]